MKGLDGIQGPIYVGTGCVFRRQAFYGYDAPITKKLPTRTCNCWPNWCCCSGKRNKKKGDKLKTDVKNRNSRQGGPLVCTLKCIEDGNEGKFSNLKMRSHSRSPNSYSVMDLHINRSGWICD